MRRIKVLHLLQSKKFSGAENVACQIIDLFKGDPNFEMIYCSKEGPIRDSLDERNITFLPLNKFNLIELKKCINKCQPDIIHAHDPFASVSAATVSNNIPIISHVHGNHDNMKIFSLKSLSFLVSSFRYKQIFWVSNSSYMEYKFTKYVQKKSNILMNIINRDKVMEKANLDNSNYLYDCVFVGRLNDIKNPLRAIRIISKVNEKNKYFKAAFVGDGELYEECKKLILELGLEKNVSLLGFRNNPYKIISDAKLLLSTSKYEGTPMCALEAMALDIPIVSTPTDGLNELIYNGVTGYLSNDDEELADAILNVISNENKRSTLSNETNKRFQLLNDLNNYKKTLYKAYRY